MRSNDRSAEPISRAEAASQWTGWLSELRQAGSPPSVAPDAVRFETLVATIVPLADLDSGVVQSPGRAIRTVSVPYLAPQGGLSVAVASGVSFCRSIPVRPARP